MIVKRVVVIHRKSVMLYFFSVLCSTYFLVRHQCKEMSSRKLLESPIDDTKVSHRTDLPLLNTKYVYYKTALHQLIIDWLDGNVGSGAPIDDCENDLIRKVNEMENQGVIVKSMENDAECQTVYNSLVNMKALNHLKIATSHRNWITNTFQLLKKAGVQLSEKVVQLIRIHDLSKYTHHEVLGYAIKFGKGRVETPEEQNEWELALAHHLSHNPHHPQYFHRVSTEDKTAERTNGLIELGVAFADRYLVESLIDMLACRGERHLGDDEQFSLTKWLDIEMAYMERYSRKDKEFVVKLLNNWRHILQSLTTKQLESLRGHFDKRPVVY